MARVSLQTNFSRHFAWPLEVDGKVRGCDGGNMRAMWTNNMRDLERNLWVDGEGCAEYNLKCWKYSGGARSMTH